MVLQREIYVEPFADGDTHFYFLFSLGCGGNISDGLVVLKPLIQLVIPSVKVML